MHVTRMYLKYKFIEPSRATRPSHTGSLCITWGISSLWYWLIERNEECASTVLYFRSHEWRCNACQQKKNHRRHKEQQKSSSMYLCVATCGFNLFSVTVSHRHANWVSHGRPLIHSTPPPTIKAAIHLKFESTCLDVHHVVGQVSVSLSQPKQYAHMDFAKIRCHIWTHAQLSLTVMGSKSL